MTIIYLKNFLKLLLATSFIYILGMSWLGNLIGWDKPIFQLGAQPFLLAELFKILIATFAINQIKKIKEINIILSWRSFRKNSLKSSSVHFKSSSCFRNISIT